MLFAGIPVISATSFTESPSSSLSVNMMRCFGESPADILHIIFHFSLFMRFSSGEDADGSSLYDVSAGEKSILVNFPSNIYVKVPKSMKYTESTTVNLHQSRIYRSTARGYEFPICPPED